MSELGVQETKRKPSEERVWEKYYNEEALNFDFPKMNIYDAVYEENKNRKDCTALEYEGSIVPFGEFFDKVEEKTEFLKDCGIKEKDVVTVSMLMSPDFVYDWYALARLNAISNLIDPRTSPEGIRDYIEEAESDYILNTNLFLPKIIQAIKDGKNYRVINYSLDNYAQKIEGPLGPLTGAMTLFGKVASKFDPRIINVGEVGRDSKEETTTESKYKEGQPLTIVHTGGTTGTPKGVLLTHDNYNAMAYEYKKSNCDFAPNDRFLLIMPPWISYGSGMLHMSLITGMKAAILSKPNTKKMDRLILKYEPQWFAGVPAHFKSVSESKRIAQNKVRFLKGGACGGDAMSPHLYEKATTSLIENGARNGVDPGYGLTEATSAFAVKQTKDFKPGSVGIPLPGCTVGIFKFDEEKEETLDEELGYNETGEICLRTPNMMAGYFKNEEKTKTVLRTHKDGNVWIHTGDLGYIDEDGFLFVNGRIKEMITRYDGFKVYPSLIEKVINNCDGVLNCKVVGVNDNIHGTGQIPKAFIVVKSEYATDPSHVLNDVKKKCKQVLPEYYIENMDYECLEKMPLTDLGKVDFTKLAEQEKEKQKTKKIRFFGKK